MRHRIAFLGSLAALLASPAGAQHTWQRVQSGEPLPRYRAALVFDPLNSELVLFGGSPNATNHTWTHDGNVWERREPLASPARQQAPGLVFDSARGLVVLFGRRELGNGAAETVEWDGANWTPRALAIQPAPRERAGMAYDAARARTVLFGGANSFTPRGDTWEYDGTSWSPRTPATSPSPRWLCGMTYDAARQRTVLFGGFGTSTHLDETWEWDGTNWTQRTLATRPSARQVSAMTYDSARQRVVLFGGFVATSGGLGDTWEYDGTSWQQRFPVHAPPATFDGMLAYDAARAVSVLFGGTTATFGAAGHWEWDGNDWREVRKAPLPRQGHALAYDPERDRTVLFGGVHDPARLNDTWEWDGTGWLAFAPASAPSARTDPAMTYDGARKRVLLFGGDQGGLELADTWEWDGARWIERFPATRPPARRSTSMAYDERRGRVLLFGGDGGQLTPSLADTWEWDGNDWRELRPASVPPARNQHTLTYDARRGRVVLFGGQACLPFQGCTPLDDTWEWDGADWRVRTTPAAPSARGHAGATFDRQRGRTLVFGGLGGALLDELWEWNGSEWSARVGTSSPDARYGAELAYDAGSGRTVLFGGTDGDSLLSSEVFELAVPCDTLGPGHASGSLALNCSTTPRIGTNLCLEFSAPASSGLNGLLLARGPWRSVVALNQAFLCAPGFLYVPPGFRALFRSGDPASFCADLAPSASLVGASFVLQGALLETSGCWRLTDGLVLTRAALMDPGARARQRP